MAKNQQPANDNDSVARLITGWFGVSKSDEPDAFARWEAFRHDKLGSRARPNAYTVPSLLPPDTPQAIAEYIAVIAAVRRAIGWNGPSGRRKAA